MRGRTRTRARGWVTGRPWLRPAARTAAVVGRSLPTGPGFGGLCVLGVGDSGGGNSRICVYLELDGILLYCNCTAQGLVVQKQQ